MPFSEKVKLEAKKRSFFRCCVCKRSFVEVHHIIPQAEGGPDTLDNAAPLCASCHDLFGGNPSKRKQIREMRDQWWEVMEKRETAISSGANFRECVFEEDRTYLSKMRTSPVALYHVVFENEGFEESAQILFKMIERTQKLYPGRPRHLFLDIEGHRNENGSFDEDMFELQRHFVLGYLGQFLSELFMPLLHVKMKTQSNDIPSKILVAEDKATAVQLLKENPHFEKVNF